MYMYVHEHIHVFPKLTKSCIGYCQTLLTLKQVLQCIYVGCNDYSVQGLVAKVKDTVANG